MKDRQVKCQVRKDKTSIRGGMKLMHQPRHKDHPAYRKSKGQWQPKARKTGAKPPKSNAGCPGAGCRDYKSGMRQSPGSARRGRDVNPASRHSTRPKQEGSNICPGEGEGKESTRTERPPSVPQ